MFEEATERLFREVENPEEHNVKTVLRDLYGLATAESITDLETGEEVSRIEFQDMIYQDIESLSYLLGIELEEE